MFENLLNINWRNHPTQKEYTVFFFDNKSDAEEFKLNLIQKKIWFEEHIDDDKKIQYFFAVKKIRMKETIEINHMVRGQSRYYFIKDKFFRTLILLITFGSILLAFIGLILK